MSIVNPAQLVAEFKKSGGFDRMRREVLAEFQKSDAMIPLMSRVEDIVRQKLQSDKKLEYLPHEAVHRELMDELDRYPIVDRAFGDFRSRSNGSFSRAVNKSLKGILHSNREQYPVEDDTGSKMDISPTDAGTAITQADSVDQLNNDMHIPRTTPPGAHNDNMDIKGSSDGSAVDIPNKVSVEPTADNSSQTA